MAHPVSAATRTLTGTIVAICRAEQLQDTLAQVRALHAQSAVRPLIVTLGDVSQPPIREDDGATIIENLVPRYLDNVVAARRLSSLPAMAWWRGGDRQVLAAVAPLVDRLVLDSDDPPSDWRAAVPLLDVTSIGDLRWTRLTRWRNLMAQFFDLATVRAAAGEFSELRITAADAHAARLFAAWLSTRLPAGRALQVEITTGAPFISRITLRAGDQRLDLRLTPAATCVRTSVEAGKRAVATRTVSLGNQSPASLLEEEMRIRARDAAFEDALRSVAEAV